MDSGETISADMQVSELTCTRKL